MLGPRHWSQGSSLQFFTSGGEPAASSAPNDNVDWALSQQANDGPEVSPVLSSSTLQAGRPNQLATTVDVGTQTTDSTLGTSDTTSTSEATATDPPNPREVPDHTPVPEIVSASDESDQQHASNERTAVSIDLSEPSVELLEEAPVPEPAPARRKHAKTDAQTVQEYATLEPHGLDPVTTTIDNHWMYVFFRFCAERHRMQELRDSGVPRDQLSKDETMQKEHIGNIYREMDAGSKRMKEQIIAVGDQSHEEICCESGMKRRAYDVTVLTRASQSVCSFFPDSMCRPHGRHS